MYPILDRFQRRFPGIIVSLLAHACDTVMFGILPSQYSAFVQMLKLMKQRLESINRTEDWSAFFVGFKRKHIGKKRLMQMISLLGDSSWNMEAIFAGEKKPIEIKDDAHDSLDDVFEPLKDKKRKSGRPKKEKKDKKISKTEKKDKKHKSRSKKDSSSRKKRRTTSSSTKKEETKEPETKKPETKVESKSEEEEQASENPSETSVRLDIDMEEEPTIEGAATPETESIDEEPLKLTEKTKKEKDVAPKKPVPEEEDDEPTQEKDLIDDEIVEEDKEERSKEEKEEGSKEEKRRRE